MPYLTALRGFAALYVLLYHLFGRIPRELGFDAGIGNYAPDSLITGISSLGWYGADIFFVLSGFIITLRYIHRLQFDNGWRTRCGSFLIKRITRIYPPYFASIIALMLIAPNPLVDRSYFDLDSIWLHLSLSYAWMPRAEYAESWNFPGWSVSIEFLGYLFFPLAALGLSKLPGRPVGDTVASMSLCLMVLVAFSQDVVGPSAVIRGVGHFLMGAFTGLLFLHFGPRLPGTLFAIGLLGAVAWFSCWGWSQLVGTSASCLMIYGLASAEAHNRVIHTLFGNAGARRLGTWSYSLYVWQYPLLLVIGWISTGLCTSCDATFQSSPQLALAATILSLCMIVLSAAVLHKLFEAPAIRLSKSIRM